MSEDFLDRDGREWFVRAFARFCRFWFTFLERALVAGALRYVAKAAEGGGVISLVLSALAAVAAWALGLWVVWTLWLMVTDATDWDGPRFAGIAGFVELLVVVVTVVVAGLLMTAGIGAVLDAVGQPVR